MFSFVHFTMIQASTELGLDEWVTGMLNNLSSVYLLWSDHRYHRFFKVVRLKSKSPRHIKYGAIIEYAKYKKILNASNLGELDLESLFNKFIEELKSCSWTRLSQTNDTPTSTDYVFEMLRKANENEATRQATRRLIDTPNFLSLAQPQHSLAPDPNIFSMPMQLDEAARSMRGTAASARVPAFSQSRSLLPAQAQSYSRQPVVPQSSNHPSSSRVTQQQPRQHFASTSSAASDNATPRNSIAYEQLERFKIFILNENISSHDLKSFRLRILVQGRIIIDQLCNLNNHGFQICYGNNHENMRIIEEHEPEMASMLRPVGFNNFQIQTHQNLERDVKAALKAFMCGGVLLKYNEDNHTVIMYRFSQTRVFVKSHLHQQFIKAERTCRDNGQNPATVFSYPKYAASSPPTQWAESRLIQFKIGTSKIKVELEPSVLDRLNVGGSRHFPDEMLSVNNSFTITSNR